jgi:pyruvate carboxylase
VTIVDRSIDSVVAKNVKADPNDKKQVGAGMPGMVVTVGVKTGDAVEKGQKLLSLEAMKMETTMVSDRIGVVKEIFVKPGSRVESGDLLLTFE